MMMLRLTALLSLFTVVAATPALVWKSSSSNTNSIETVYTSEERTADDLLSEIIHDENDQDKLSIVFVLGRDDGNESLTRIAPQLSTVSTKPANYIHQHVTGVQSSTRLFSKEEDALVVNLDELHMKLNGNNIDNDSSMEMDAMGQMNNNKAHNKRVKKIQNANLLVVDIDANTVETDVLDKTIAEAIEFETSNVILTAVRGIQEVKRERELTARRRFDNQMKAGRKLQENRQRGRRRLEDQDGEGDNENGNNNNNNQDLSGVYYVNLTPNIFAGILFMFLFLAITMTGISCMNMIIGQDTFTDKMPFVGREA